MQPKPKSPCFKCRHADIILQVTPNTATTMQIVNQATIWCKQRGTIIKYPFEKCNIQKESIYYLQAILLYEENNL